MGKGRIIFVFIVSIISLTLIYTSFNQKGYEKVGRVNEYVLYYDESFDSEEELDKYILKEGFYEIRLGEAIENEELTEEYIENIFELIEEFEKLENK